MSDTQPTQPSYGPLKTLAVRLTEDFRAQLDIIAQLNDRSVTEEIRVALESWIESSKNDPAVLQRFASVVRTCILDIGCEYLEADVLDRIDTLRDSLPILLEEIHDRAPNAVIYAAGYPNLFETGSSCIFVGAADWPWLRNASLELNTAIEETLDDFATDTGATVTLGDPTLEFAGKNLCETPSAINGVVLTLTDGEGPQLPWFTDLGASQESVHPNYLGTDLYAEVMEDALVGLYP